MEFPDINLTGVCQQPKGQEGKEQVPLLSFSHFALFIVGPHGPVNPPVRQLPIWKSCIALRYTIYAIYTISGFNCNVMGGNSLHLEYTRKAVRLQQYYRLLKRCDFNACRILKSASFFALSLSQLAHILHVLRTFEPLVLYAYVCYMCVCSTACINSSEFGSNGEEEEEEGSNAYVWPLLDP